jgi:hypothetical protein
MAAGGAVTFRLPHMWSRMNALVVKVGHVECGSEWLRSRPRADGLCASSTSRLAIGGLK